jgi:hypothetical protein
LDFNGRLCGYHHFYHLSFSKEKGKNHSVMNKETILSAVRAIFTFAGTFLIGHSLFGHALSADLWQLILGAVVTIISVTSSLVTKDAQIESLQSGVRQILVAAGGVLLSLGVIKQETFESAMAAILAIIPVIQSYVSKEKVKQIDQGKLVPKPDGSGKLMKAGPKGFTAVLVAFLLMACVGANAQSIFEPVPKINQAFVKLGVNRMGVPAPPDSTVNLFRPTAVASISFPGNIAQAGFGMSYQHLKYDFDKARWQSVYSFGLYALGGATTGTQPAQPPVISNQGIIGVASVSFLVGFAGDIIRLGPQYNFQVPPGYKTHWGISAVIGLNFNN